MRTVMPNVLPNNLVGGKTPLSPNGYGTCLRNRNVVGSIPTRGIMSDYTILRGLDDDALNCNCRKNVGVKEFYGYCEVCWVKLSPADRAALKGEEVPKVDVTVTTRNAPTFIDSVWRFTMTVAVAFLLFDADLRCGGHVTAAVISAYHHIQGVLHVATQ